MAETVISKFTVTVDLTGPDWEPTAATKYFAQLGKNYAFGPTKRAALAALKEKVSA